jgi:hypothetical protein
MRPTASPQQSGQSEMCNRRLDDCLYETHEIIKLAQHVDWNMFDRQYDSQYHPDHVQFWFVIFIFSNKKESYYDECN